MRGYLPALVLLVSVHLSKGAALWSWSYENNSRDIRDVLRDGFDYANTKGQFGIGSDDSLIIAPSPSGDGTYVLRVFYKEGTFSSHNSSGDKCVKGVPCQRGAQFYAEPTSLAAQNYTTLTLEYEIEADLTRDLKAINVWFDETFQWNRGGKLPGLWGGTRDCSGSRISDTCFSTRLMWRSDGDGEVYAYVTHGQQPSWDQFCEDNDHLSSCEKYRQIHCTSSSGIQIGKGTFQFKTNQWNKIRQEVYLNSLPEEPGYVKLWVNDRAEIYVNNITMRINNDFGIDGMFFSTFYGGSDSSWACPNDTYTYYRNFRISTDTDSPSMCQLVG